MKADTERAVFGGGSNDGTVELIRREAGTVGAWVSGPDRGIFDAINKGARLARGRVLWLLDADDRLEPCALDAVLARPRDGGHPPAAITVGATSGSMRVASRPTRFRIRRPSCRARSSSGGLPAAEVMA